MAEDKKVVTKKTVTKKIAAAAAPAGSSAPVTKKVVAKQSAPPAPPAPPTEPAAPLTKKTAAKKAPAKKAVAKKAPAKPDGRQAALPDRAVLLKPVGEVTPEERYRMIGEAAYYRAEKRGFAPGGEHEDWAAAVAEIDAMLSKGAE
jgi:hypothetical protein